MGLCHCGAFLKFCGSSMGARRNLDTYCTSRPVSSFDPNSGSEELPEHVLQDSTMRVVRGLGRGVDAHLRLEAARSCVRLDRHGHRVWRAVPALEAGDGECLFAGETEALRALAVEELQRQ